MKDCKINAKSALQRAHIKQGKYQEDCLKDAYAEIEKATEKGKTEVFVRVPSEFSQYVSQELNRCGFKTRYVTWGYEYGLEIWWDGSRRFRNPELIGLAVFLAIIACIGCFFQMTEVEK